MVEAVDYDDGHLPIGRILLACLLEQPFECLPLLLERVVLGTLRLISEANELTVQVIKKIGVDTATLSLCLARYERKVARNIAFGTGLHEALEQGRFASSWGPEQTEIARGMRTQRRFQCCLTLFIALYMGAKREPMLETKLKPVGPTECIQQFAARPSRPAIIASDKVAQCKGQVIDLRTSRGVLSDEGFRVSRCPEREFETAKEALKTRLRQARRL